MAQGFLSRNMDFVLSIWDPWDLGREWCDEACISCGECTYMVATRGGSWQMMWWESREAWKEEEGRARQRREEGSGKRWERRRRQSSGDLHHDRKDRERKLLQCLW